MFICLFFFLLAARYQYSARMESVHIGDIGVDARKYLKIITYLKQMQWVS